MFCKSLNGNPLIVSVLLVFGCIGSVIANESDQLPAKPELLFLLGGQSNMAGGGYTADLPDTDEYKRYHAAPGNVSIWNAEKKSWQPLEIGKRFGPEIGFAHALSTAHPGKHVGLVKSAAGGTSMDKWAPGGKLYTRLISAFRDASKSAPDAKLAAMLWHQGESDSDTKEVAQAYRGKMVRFIASVRKDTQEPDLLFILGQINPAKTYCGRPRFLHAGIVKKAQAELKAPNTVMIKTDDCEMNPYHWGFNTPKEKRIPKNEDNIHYSGKGQIKMGRRFAEAYQANNIAFNYSKAELLTVKDGAHSDPFIAESPDPMHTYRWPSPQASDDLQTYALKPVAVSATAPCSGLESLSGDKANVTINGTGRILLDFGVESAGWLEIESPDLDGDVEFGLSEYSEYAILNGPHIKKKKPVKVGPSTYRLSLNKALYEGVRFGFVHINSFDKPWHITKARIICQTKPTNYNGSFKCSDPMLTKIWYVGAYGVKLNLLKDYYGAILMDRGDRHSWTGDAHPSQAASMVAFGNYDFVKHNIDRTSTQYNGIRSYSLYWVLSLFDYYRYTGDTATLKHYLPNVKAKLDDALKAYGKNPRLGFYGWDDRIGAGFEDHSCPENQKAYKMLTIRACREFAQALGTQSDLAALSFQAGDKAAGVMREYYREKADELMKGLRKDDPAWYSDFGIHASADAICTGLTSSEENKQMFHESGFDDRLQRLSYSPFNQYWIIQALAIMNRYDEAYSSILDLWGGQIQYGGTTFFETFRPAWGEMLGTNDAVPNNQAGYTSLCHPWGGGVTKWLTEEVLGIKPSSPGFETFAVIPHLGRRLTSVEGKVRTPHGEIKASFDVTTGKCSITVPEGTTGTLAIPKAEKTINAIKINGKLAWKGNGHPVTGIGDAKEDAEFIYFTQVQPGTYSAVVSYSGKTPSYDPGPYLYRAPFVKHDRKTQGNWGGVYGKDGYALLNYDGKGNHRVTMPAFCKSIAYHMANHANLTMATQDARAPAADSSNAAARKVGLIHTGNPAACKQRFCVDIEVEDNSTYDLALYFVDWDKSGMRLSAEIMDLETKELIGSTKYVGDSTNGAYLVYRVTGSCRVSVNHIRGRNATLSALFFDKVKQQGQNP